MSNEQLKSNQRYKGVESFLRRIAFNLGNSPSQTEVKIISCIPIDVSDLQQKIISLEKELEEAKGNAQNQQNTVVQSVICPHLHATPPTYQRGSNETSQTPRIDQCEGACLKRSASLGSQGSMPSPSPIDYTCWPSDISTSQNNEQAEATERRGFFKKSKKKKAKKKEKLQIFYAQTDNNPFANSKYDTCNYVKAKREPNDKLINDTYIEEMVQKQYAKMPIAEEYAITSQFSSPVCRDIEHSCEQYSSNRCDTDLCSCFRGAYHNIDLHNDNDNLPTCSYDTFNRNIKFYDTSLYDMVPVRERPLKNPNLFYESPKKKLADCSSSTSCFAERKRHNYRYHPFIVNYSNASPAPHIYSQRTTRSSNKREKCKKISPRRVVDRKAKKYNEDSSKSCSIDCGEIYTKKVNVDGKTQSANEPLITGAHKNAESLTINVNDTECQTITSQSVQIDNELLDDNKTEETLNQIKDILQTVLTEVKTNAQTNKTPDEKQTKDAVVQKGISQGNMPGCSELLQSYTYSPYNMHPYIASCSRQNSGRCFFPNVPFPSGKYLQNFPVFIQNPGRNVCASCYRNSSHIPKAPKQAATIATNTDPKEHSTETEKLIKEIYKSIAVNLAAPNKDTSLSEYDDLKPIRRQSQQGSKPDVTLNNFDSKTNNKLTSNTISLRTQVVSTTDTEKHSRNSRIESYLRNLEDEKVMHGEIEKKEIFEENTSSSSEDDEDEIISNDESEDRACAAMSKKQPVKKGIFRKMFRKSVKIFGTKKKREEPLPVVNATDDECEDDSDDYETVYSERATPKDMQYVHYRARPGKVKTFPSHHKYNIYRDENKRTPYMEQEDRCHWNKMIFQDQQPDMQSRNPVYWRNFDARSAIVGHRNANVTPRESVPLRPQGRYNRRTVNVAAKGVSWLKKHKPNIRCGEQWKKFVLEN